jgi:hypothetical protein
MVIIFYLILYCIAVLSLKYIRRSLHPIEILCCLLFVSILGQEFFVIVYLNLKLIEASDSKIHFLLVALNRLILIPIIVAWFISKYWSIDNLFKKALLTFTFTLFLTGVEYVGDWLGLITHTAHWNAWWTLLEWLGIVLLTVLFSGYLRKRLPGVRL